MFGSKKRNYRKEVAKVLIGMAMPLDIELKTKNIYLLLRHSIDQYYFQNMMPIQAEMFIKFEYLLERGVAPRFAIETLKAGSDAMWYPRRKALLGGGVLTE